MRASAFAALAAVTVSMVMLTACDQKKETETVTKQQQSTPLDAAANQKFLTDNGAKDGVITRPSGLQYRVITAGSGKGVSSGSDMVTVTYKGALITGKVFDQTAPGQTATFPAGRLIPGWVEALSLMKEGDEWQIVIPSELGYGARGAGGDIPPNQTLVFDMKLVGVNAN
ncbi:MAG TPA: FKBP-type peptidyl-prolyl cis-trans isomerase [Rhizomicrobium sp.]|nr:FKBP-type peptidyl-prolyl cis-trans isomerase [Rhizomicrobium sp.]